MSLVVFFNYFNMNFFIITKDFNNFSSINLNYSLCCYSKFTFSTSPRSSKNEPVKQEETNFLTKTITPELIDEQIEYVDDIVEFFMKENRSSDEKEKEKHRKSKLIFAKFRGAIQKNGNFSYANKVINEILLRLSKNFDLKRGGEKINPSELLVFSIYRIRLYYRLENRRFGGTRYDLPFRLSSNSSISIAIRWILNKARSSKGNFIDNLYTEISDIILGKSDLLKKKDDTHQTGFSNLPFLRRRRRRTKMRKGPKISR